MATVGFLHTAHGHVRIFRDLLLARDDSVDDRHLVDPRLHLLSRHENPAVVRAMIADRLQRLVAEGSDVLLCTCSTIAAEAKAVGAELGIRVIRVDRPMAEAAVLAGRRIAVVTSLAEAVASLYPLLRECAQATGREVEFVDVTCADSWSSFAAGDLLTYATTVADAVRRAVRSLERPVDVVVLAQASMVGAAPLLRDLDMPVLTSPRLAVEAAVELVQSLVPAQP